MSDDQIPMMACGAAEELQHVTLMVWARGFSGQEVTRHRRVAFLDKGVADYAAELTCY